MINKIRRYLFLILCVVVVTGMAQNRGIDSLKNLLQLKSNSDEKIDLLINLGKRTLNIPDLNQAGEYTAEALELALKSGNKYYIKNCYELRTAVALKRNDYKNARQYFQLFITYRDSILAEENTKKQIEEEMRYEFDKKVEADKLLRDKINLQHATQSHQQNIIILIVIAGFLLVVIFSLFLYNRFRLITRQKKIIEIQKHEVESQKKLADERRIIAEKQSRIIEQKQKEILDSIRYARRIQNALMPSDKYLDKSINKFKR